MLSLVSRGWAEGIAFWLWVYVAHWTSGFLASLWWTAGPTVAATLLTATMSKALFVGWVSPTAGPGLFGAFGWARFGAWSMLLLFVFPLAMAWPPAYLLIRTRRQRQLTKILSAG